MTNPNTTGFYRFSGIRRVRNGGKIVQTTELAEVRRVDKGRHETELAVAFFGRARLYDLRNFEGTWKRLRLVEEVTS